MSDPATRDRRGGREEPNADLVVDITLDLSGLICPLPVLRARKALLGMAPGARLAVIATDPMAAIDMPHFCNEAGHTLIASTRTETNLRFVIARGPDRPPSAVSGGEA